MAFTVCLTFLACPPGVDKRMHASLLLSALALVPGSWYFPSPIVLTGSSVRWIFDYPGRGTSCNLLYTFLSFFQAQIGMKNCTWIQFVIIYIYMHTSLYIYIQYIYIY